MWAQAFACDGFGYNDRNSHGNSERWFYLHTDYAIRCTYGSFTSAEHEYIKGVAYPLIVLWPMGIPLLFWALLYHSRVASHRERLAKAISFLRREYTEQCWYWEVGELCRKEILAGFLLLVPQQLNFLRIVLALLLSICYLVLLPAASPFRSSSTHFVATVTSVSLCCTYFAALLVKVIDSDSVETSNDGTVRAHFFGFDSAFPITLIILAFNFGVLGITFLFFVQQAYADMHAPVLRLRSTGHRPELGLAPHHAWAMFLSHQVPYPL